MEMDRPPAWNFQEGVDGKLKSNLQWPSLAQPDPRTRALQLPLNFYPPLHSWICDYQNLTIAYFFLLPLPHAPTHTHAHTQCTMYPINYGNYRSI